MTKTLTKTGNSLALILDRPLLEQLHIDANTQLEISTDGHAILISPVRDKKRDARFKAIADDMFTRYAGVFRKLAE